MPKTRRLATAAVILSSVACSDDSETTHIETTTDTDGGEAATDAESTTSGHATTSADSGQTTTTGGDPCDLGGNVCLDENTLGVCNDADQSTMSVSCQDTCESRGFSMAIGCSVATDGKHQCYCDQASAACTESMCGGGNVLAECSDSVIDPRDCEGECQATGQAGRCDYDDENGYFCGCFPGGCVEGTTFCVDPQTEMRCTNGTWHPGACSDEACRMKMCPDVPSDCPPDYEARTLGCGYDSYYGDTLCLCTS